jgi:hypothetical protein
MAKISMNGHRLILSPQTLTTLALSAIEVFPNETGGQLWGKINGEIYYPEMIYPLQTGKRSPRSFDSGNQSAIKRIKDIELALRGEPFKTRFLGEYHSHCGREVSRQPSPKDLDAFDYLMKDRSQNYWLEVITNIERFSTEKPTKIDPRVSEFDRKTRVVIHSSNYTVYWCLVSAYLTERNGKTFEVKVVSPFAKNYK